MEIGNLMGYINVYLSFLILLRHLILVLGKQMLGCEASFMQIVMIFFGEETVLLHFIFNCCFIVDEFMSMRECKS